MEKGHFSSNYSEEIKGFICVYNGNINIVINKLYVDENQKIKDSLYEFLEHNNNCTFAILKNNNVIYK